MTAAQAVDQARRDHPLDIVEEILVGNEWLHERASQEELAAEVEGRWCNYKLFFVWREETRALHFSCCLDMRIQPENMRDVRLLLSHINANLWLGHFEVTKEDPVPLFRYTSLHKGGGISSESLEDLMNLALSECERHYPAFQFVVWGGKSPEEAIEASIFETVGEA